LVLAFGLAIGLGVERYTKLAFDFYRVAEFCLEGARKDRTTVGDDTI